MDGFKVEVEAQVYPTEDVEKVKRAVGNLFEGELTVIQYPGGGVRALKGEGKSLDSLRSLKDILKRDRVRSAARAALTSGLSGKRITVYLNKQVALAKHVSFCGPELESPLGPITIKVEGENPIEAIEWLVSRNEWSL